MDENNELMNTEVIETFDSEVDYVESDGKFGMGVGVGVITTLVGGLIYKYVVDPLWRKHKDKKRQKAYLEEHGPVLGTVVNDETEE